MVDNKVVLKNRGRTRFVPIYELGYQDLEFLTEQYVTFLKKNRTDYDTDEIDMEARETISKVVYKTLQERDVWLILGTETCESVRSPVAQCSTFYRDIYRPALDYYDLYKPEGLGVKAQDIAWVRARYKRGLSASVIYEYRR